jgi:hypothetical protein
MAALATPLARLSGFTGKILSIRGLRSVTQIFSPVVLCALCIFCGEFTLAARGRGIGSGEISAELLKDSLCRSGTMAGRSLVLIWPIVEIPGRVG